MSNAENDTTISAVDKAATVGEIRKPANSGKRWGSIDLHKLWDHLHNFDKPSERKCYCTNCEKYWRGIDSKKNTEYEPLADWIGRSNTACRIKVCKIKFNLRKGAISLEDALAGKRLPLEPPKKLVEQAAKEGATSSKRALSDEDSKPTRAPKRQKQRTAEKGALSPEAALPEKPRSVQARKARKQTAAEKRTSSSENTLSDEPLSSQTSKPQKQAAAKKKAEKRASSSEDAVDEKPPCCQASQSQDHAPTESRACSPEDALTEVPQPCPASTPQQQISVGDTARFRTADGGRMASQHTAVERDVADALVNLSQWGNMTVAQRSHALGEQLYHYNIQPDQQ